MSSRFLASLMVLVLLTGAVAVAGAQTSTVQRRGTGRQPAGERRP
jgi:hypothetical protein